jgi:hypothetical protein
MSKPYSNMEFTFLWRISEKIAEAIADLSFAEGEVFQAIKDSLFAAMIRLRDEASVGRE